jgi:hypothetical protein
MTAPVAAGAFAGWTCTHWKAPPSHGARPKREFSRSSVLVGSPLPPLIEPTR